MRVRTFWQEINSTCVWFATVSPHPCQYACQEPDGSDFTVKQSPSYFLFATQAAHIGPAVFKPADVTFFHAVKTNKSKKLLFSYLE